MERLFSVKDVCARYQVKPTTARKFMREMEHMEQPLMVSERAVCAWERRKTFPPESITRNMLKGAKHRNGTLAVNAPCRKPTVAQNDHS